MKLIVVESPIILKNKGYGGSDYEVASCVGHICDLPVGGSGIGIHREHSYALKYLEYPISKPRLKHRILQAAASNTASADFLSRRP